MTIQYKATVSDHNKSPYFCVKYGSATIVFKNETEAFAAFKALSAAIGATSYYTYSSERCRSYSIYDVVRNQDITLERKLFVLENDVNPEMGHCVVEEIPIVKCDENNCWKSEELVDNCNLPDGWQKIKDDVLMSDSKYKHYCKDHCK